MDFQKNKAADEAQLRTIINDRLQAIRQKDVNGALAGYASDILSFDVVDPLQFNGLDAVKKRLEIWFSSFQEESIGFDINDLQITIDTEIAYCHNLNHIHAFTTDGKKLDMWWRETTCYKKINGKWMIIHAHSSVPFNTETGKASLGLKPDKTD